MGFSTFAGGSLIHFLEIRHEGLAMRPGDVLQAIANLVNDTALDLGLGEDRQDRFLEPAQPIHASNENILYATRLQVRDDTPQEIRRLIALAAPMPQHIS